MEEINVRFDDHKTPWKEKNFTCDGKPIYRFKEAKLSGTWTKIKWKEDLPYFEYDVHAVQFEISLIEWLKKRRIKRIKVRI
jgi:hypothetical protein